jgi:hypothetical protein
MPRGGARPGAGRPRKSAAPAVDVPTPADAPLTPLALLEAVMLDTRQDLALRVSAAKALLPYRHARVAALGAKAQREIEALGCERGTKWEGLLSAPPLPPEADTPRRDDGSPDWDKLLA